MGEVVDERCIVNAIVGLLATGGSTNHTIHLVAIARAAGIVIDWDDFDELSAAVPLLARVYPNGKADVNHFHAAGGMGVLIRELLDAGLLHADVRTVAGPGLARYADEPVLDAALGLRWQPSPARSLDNEVLRGVAAPFSADGGLRLLNGNLGRAVIKVSAVKAEHRVVEAPAIVFDSQDELMRRFRAGELHRDFIAVVRFQGPRANGMPELHKLTPRSACCRTRASRWRWSPTGACPARRARCRPPSTSRPRRWPAARWRVCATATCCAWTPNRAGSNCASMPQNSRHATRRCPI